MKLNPFLTAILYILIIFVMMEMADALPHIVDALEKITNKP